MHRASNASRLSPRAANIAAPANTIASASALRVHIGYRPVRLDSPELRPVEVIDGVTTSRDDEVFARWLHVAGLVDGARGDDRFTALETPRHSKARQRDRQPRFLQLRGYPTPSAVGRDFNALDFSVTRPREAGQFVQTEAWQSLPSRRERDDRLCFHLIREN